MAGLTTHVLDTTHGRPAAGLALRLRDRDAGPAAPSLVDVRTNADGRVDAPLIAAAEMRKGRFRLEFDVADYFRAQGVDLPDPPFLETVVIDFAIAEPDQHYHVPLLVSPYGYSTYRGS